MTIAWVCCDCLGLDGEIAYRWWREAHAGFLDVLRGGGGVEDMEPGTYPADDIKTSCEVCGGTPFYDRTGYLMPLVERQPALTNRVA